MKLKIFLSHNPHVQKIHEVKTVEEAQGIVKELSRTFSIEVLGGGKVTQNGKRIATISYNGKITK